MGKGEVCDESKNRHNSKESEIYEKKNINEDVPFNTVSNGHINKVEENVVPKLEPDKIQKVYNCYTCNIQIYNHTFLRFHFKSEWHKYNLKRKLLNLGCVDELTFNKKIANLNKAQEERKEKKKNKEENSSLKKKKEKKKERKCNGSSTDLNVDIQSEKLKNWKYATPEKVLLEKNVPYDNPLICFFDNRIFVTIEENKEHMKREYTFSLPDEKYVTSFKKVYLIIGKAIYEENICIYCFKHFKSVKAVQMHMLCNGHTKIDNRFSFFIEKYYDFTNTYVTLINKYIQSKEDKEQILHLIDITQKERDEIAKEKNKKRHNKKLGKSKENQETEKEKGKGKGKEKDEQNEQNDENFDSQESIEESSQKETNKSDNENFINEDENESDISDVDITEKIEREQKQNKGKHIEDTKNTDILLANNNETDLNVYEDFKITEKELKKNINADVVYEVLEQFGYNKPEINEYNNLILPDGSEAINRNIAYIFQQDFSILSRSNNEIILQMDKPEKRNRRMDYKHMKYYINYMKKLQLDISVKHNKLNKYMKTESICFF